MHPSNFLCCSPCPSSPEQQARAVPSFYSPSNCLQNLLGFITGYQMDTLSAKYKVAIYPKIRKKKKKS